MTPEKDSTIRINIVNESGKGRIPKSKLSKVIQYVLEGENVSDAQISVIIVDNERIHEMNRQYLQHDYPTDVITFPIEDNPIECEIYISIDTAEEQAKDYGVSLTNELMRLVAHGTLHAVGYDDSTDEQRSEMSRLETRYIQL